MADNHVLRINVLVDPVRDGKFVFPGRQANYSIVLDGEDITKTHWDTLPDLIRMLVKSAGVKVKET